jgi:hypothetical protein
MGNGSDTGGGPNTAPNGNSPDDKQLDIKVLNNGVKLLGETLVPGASLLLEKHIGAGLALGAIGVLGGAAFGSAFGPLGYVLARYGASAVSFSQSLEQPPPPPKDPNTKQMVNEVRAMRNDIASVASAFTRMAPPPPQPAPFAAPGTFAQPPAFAASGPFAQPPAFAAAASSDLSDHIAAALRKVVPEIATATGDVVSRSVRTVMEEERTPSGRTRRSAAKA